MKDLNTIGEELFDKIRGRFPSVTIGGEDGKTTNEPTDARFFDFEYQESGRPLGNVSVSISEDDGLTVIYSKDIVANEDSATKNTWFEFLKDLRQFSKKRLMDFDVRDITKSNLTKRDYKFLANRRFGDSNMNESKLYGTARTSYQKVGEARIMIKHTENVNLEASNPRTKKIGTIYIESAGGERFKYPFKHLSGARAMARHVAEGGNLYDDFGSHIIGLSEEMSKLRKFKSYMGRSAVMAESLSEYVDVVKDRINTVSKTITSLQKPKFYAEAFAAYEAPILEDVPADVAENWTDQLTIKQFNEELADVFPYIYKLVSEATKAQELGPDDLNELDESGLQYYTGVKKHGKEYMKKAAQAGREGASQEELGRLKDKYSKAEKKTKEEIAVEQGFEEMMGQFSEKEASEGQYDASDIMYEDPPIGIDFDFDNLPKVDWSKYSKEDIEKFVDHLENLDFEDGVDVSDTGYSGSYRKAAKWVEDNVLSKRKKEGNAYAEGGMSDIDIQAQEFAQDAIEMAKDIQKDDYYFSDSTYFEFTDGLDMDNDALIDHDLVQTVLRALPNVDMEPEEIKQAVDALANMNIGEDKEVDEAYINNAKDAVDVLGALRAMGKKIETGQGDDQGNLANRYANDVWDVYTWLQNKTQDFSGMDKNAKAAIDAMMKLRGEAKKLETEPGSGKNGKFGNAIVNTLYPVMELINGMKLEGGKDHDKDGDIDSDDYMAAKDIAIKKAMGNDDKETKDKKTPLGEFILSYFDKESGQFPKGETAVLTMVEKDYGEQFINPAKSFIEQISAKFEEWQMRNQPQQMETDNDEYNRVRELAGLR